MGRSNSSVDYGSHGSPSEAFAAEAIQRGGLPLVVLLPDREAVQRLRRGQPPSYAPLAQALRIRGIEYFDLLRSLHYWGCTPTETLFRPDGHYSPAGNEEVALALGPKMLQLAAAAGQRPLGS